MHYAYVFKTSAILLVTLDEHLPELICMTLKT